MFTGIIETTGIVKQVKKRKQNLELTILSDISSRLTIDQSLSHNGVCLTVTNISGNTHTVDVIAETLRRSNLKNVKENDSINLERAIPANGRFDGHFVQGHVDDVVTCERITDEKGSSLFTFSIINKNHAEMLIDKGSVCLNGVSLTIADLKSDQFSVAIIPYTFENTSFKELRKGDDVNVEFDLIGKYVNRIFRERFKT